MRNLFILAYILLPILAFPAESECMRLPDSTNEILHCKTSFKSYPRPVHFYIPTKLGSAAQLFVHFHGHNIEGFNHFDPKFANYGQYLLDSSSNAMLVIPESLGNCKTYDTFFADQVRTSQFFEELENRARNLGSRDIAGIQALSGHSGAYRVLNRLMSYANAGEKHLQNVKALGMFDALYGATPSIVNWINSRTGTDYLFYSAYVFGPKATTEQGNLILKKELKNIESSNIQFIPVKSNISSESLLDQHFMILNRGGLKSFFLKATSL